MSANRVVLSLVVEADAGARPSGCSPASFVERVATAARIQAKAIGGLGNFRLVRIERVDVVLPQAELEACRATRSARAVPREE